MIKSRKFFSKSLFHQCPAARFQCWHLLVYKSCFSGPQPCLVTTLPFRSTGCIWLEILLPSREHLQILCLTSWISLLFLQIFGAPLFRVMVDDSTRSWAFVIYACMHASNFLDIHNATSFDLRGCRSRNLKGNTNSIGIGSVLFVIISSSQSFGL